MLYVDHIDRNDLCRLADDGCPHDFTADTAVHDLPDVWNVLCKDDQDCR